MSCNSSSTICAVVEFTVVAMTLFIRFAASIGSYDLVMSNCRYFWNGLLPLINQPSERRLIRDQLINLLQSITATTNKCSLKSTTNVAGVSSKLFGTACGKLFVFSRGVSGRGLLQWETSLTFIRSDGRWVSACIFGVVLLAPNLCKRFDITKH